MSQPSQPPQPPQGAPLARRLEVWLARASAMASSTSDTAMVESLRALAEQSHAPGFRVAFVGEFNRGKSTLINRLLGKSILPVGAAPVTALITSVVAGTPERLVVTRASGVSEQRPLAPDSWNDLVARDDGQQGHIEATGDRALVVVDNAWLRDLDAELVDTPGAGDLVQERVEAVYEALARTDAAVFLISALLPFSMTEREFLEQQVLGKHIARVMVVVSQLDSVPEDERESVLESVRARVGQVAPQVTIVPSQPVSARATPDMALAGVRAQIEGLAGTSDRVLWRSRQIAERLLDTLDGMISVGEQAVEAAGLDASQRAEAQRIRQNSVMTANVQWNNLSTQLDQRALRLEEELRRRIDAGSGRLVRLLDDDLRAARDPRAWLEKRYPALVSRELTLIGQQNEEFVLTQINTDIDWMRAEVATTMRSSIATQRMSAAQTPRPAPVPPGNAPPLRDWRQMRLLARLGLGAATVALYFFTAPLAIVALPVGAALVSERLINTQERSQREIISQHMAGLVSQSIERYVSEVAGRVRQVYAQLSDELRQGQQTWARSAQAALAGNGGAGDQRAWEHLVTNASQLRQEIITTLAQ